MKERKKERKKEGVRKSDILERKKELDVQNPWKMQRKKERKKERKKYRNQLTKQQKRNNETYKDRQIIERKEQKKKKKQKTNEHLNTQKGNNFWILECFSCWTLVKKKNTR